MHTEEQAREKWCPFVRFDDTACNRHGVQAHRIIETGEQIAGHDDNNPAYARCIASECMAWRWGESRCIKNMTLKFHEKPPGYVRRGAGGWLG